MDRLKYALINAAKFLLITGATTVFLFVTGSIVFSAISISHADLLVLTRNAFALLLALATVLFSWSRNLIEENRQQALKITRYGEACFFISIVFLIAALLKYYQVQILEKPATGTLYSAFLVGMANVIFPILFFVAACGTLIVLYRIMLIWFKRFF